MLSGSITARSGADIEDTVLDYAEVKALAVGNPLVKKRVEAANELTRYLTLQRKLVDSRIRIEKELLALPGKLEHQKELIGKCEKDVSHYQVWKSSNPPVTENRLKKEESEKRKALREYITSAVKSYALETKEKTLMSYRGFDIVHILFLDEISAAPQSVQAAAYQITLDRTVGEHKLPDNCIVIAAGNRTTDKSVAFKMPKAIANRLMHIEIEGSFKSWKEWAISSGVNDKVIGFLSFRQNYLMGFDSGSDDLAFPTPRTWEMVSNILNGIDDDIDNMYSLITGIIGTGTAVEFRAWAKIYKDLTSIKDIFDGKTPAMPQNTDAMYALTASMTSYARSHKDEMSRIANSIKYADKMPPDFSAVLIKDYMYIDKDYKERLMSIPEFTKWLQSKGRLMNGSVR